MVSIEDAKKNAEASSSSGSSATPPSLDPSQLPELLQSLAIPDTMIGSQTTITANPPSGHSQPLTVAEVANVSKEHHNGHEMLYQDNQSGFASSYFPAQAADHHQPVAYGHGQVWTLDASTSISSPEGQNRDFPVAAEAEIGDARGGSYFPAQAAGHYQPAAHGYEQAWTGADATSIASPGFQNRTLAAIAEAETGDGRGDIYPDVHDALAEFHLENWFNYQRFRDDYPGIQSRIP